MSDKKGLLGSGLGRVMHNKRYIFWFWLLNLTLAEFGVSAFRQSAHAIMDHSLYALRLTDGFHASVLMEMMGRPDFGHANAMTMPALYGAIVFFLATTLFLPGVFQGYAATYRLPREDFFRACGRNLWRFIRLLIIAGIVFAIVAGILFAINGGIVKKAGESTSELLPVELNFIGLGVIFLVMTALRVWFDLAEADVVLNDQKAVRKSIWLGFKHLFRGLFRLMASYVVSTIVAAILLACGIWMWSKVGPGSWFAMFIISQITLLLLLIPRFWQRGIAVSYWQNYMLVPVATMPVIVQPVPPPMPAVIAPTPAPVTPSTTPEVPPVPPAGSSNPSV